VLLNQNRHLCVAALCRLCCPVKTCSNCFQHVSLNCPLSRPSLGVFGVFEHAVNKILKVITRTLFVFFKQISMALNTSRMHLHPGSCSGPCRQSLRDSPRFLVGFNGLLWDEGKWIGKRREGREKGKEEKEGKSLPLPEENSQLWPCALSFTRSRTSFYVIVVNIADLETAVLNTEELQQLITFISNIWCLE